jgi:hypothetical protein
MWGQTAVIGIAKRRQPQTCLHREMSCPAWLPAQMARYLLRRSMVPNNFFSIGITCHHFGTLAPQIIIQLSRFTQHGDAAGAYTWATTTAGRRDFLPGKRRRPDPVSASAQRKRVRGLIYVAKQCVSSLAAYRVVLEPSAIRLAMMSACCDA